MSMYYYFFLYLSSYFFLPTATALLKDSSSLLSTGQTLTRIAFGSCNKHNKKQVLWEPISLFHPQLFIWGGDIIYGDEYIFLPIFRYTTSVEDMRKKWVYQKTQVNEYINFTNTGVKIIGTIDDHDYGENDGGKEYKDKIHTQQLALDFLDEPQNSPRRKQQGVYAAYSFFSGGAETSSKKVRVILLDNRHMMSVEEDDMLGPEQWLWLERELREESDVLIIMAGLQIVSVGKWAGEGWRNTPRSRARLFGLVANASLTHVQRGHTAPAVVFLSGDIHAGDVSRTHWCIPASDNTNNAHVVPLLDITSSGMTHSWGTLLPFRPIVWLLEKFLHFASRGPTQLIPLVMGKNYGTIEIDWGDSENGESDSNVSRRRSSGQAKPRYLEFYIRGEKGASLFHLRSSFDELRLQANVSNDHIPYNCVLEAQRAVQQRSAFFLSKPQLAVLLCTIFGMFVWLVLLCLRSKSNAHDASRVSQHGSKSHSFC